jgi:phage terminase small subunit
VQKILDEARAKLAEMTGITAARVLNELALLGFANMADYLEPAGAERPIDLSRVTRDQMAAISELTVDTVYEQQRPVHRVRLKLHDKKGALVDIGPRSRRYRLPASGYSGNSTSRPAS